MSNNTVEIVLPVASLSVSHGADGTHSVTSCIGVPHVLQDCGTLTTFPNGSQVYTDTTTIGPWTASHTIPL